MVNPVTFPEQRRGGSGPLTDPSAGGEFLPFDNSFYFDPEYADSSENGSIAGPFTTWAQFVAAGTANEGAQFWFPGYPVVPGAEEVPTNRALVIQGQKNVDISSYISDSFTLDDTGAEEHSVTFRDMSLEAIVLSGGAYSLTFERCDLGDLSVSVAGTQIIYGFESTFGASQETPTCEVRLSGGYVTDWLASTFFLTDIYVGTPDGIQSGQLEIESTISYCRGVTFVAGSIIEFLNGPGQLYLDPSSYRSFLDNNIQLINGAVVRDDGSFPINAATYPGAVEAEIDWFANPRAYIEQTAALDLVFLRAPLTREVVLIVDNQTSGEEFAEFTWPVDCLFSAGLPPEQESGISVYKLEYEEQLGVYFVYVIGINYLPDGT